jgi:hypothetical protein
MQLPDYKTLFDVTVSYHIIYHSDRHTNEGSYDRDLTWVIPSRGGESSLCQPHVTYQFKSFLQNREQDVYYFGHSQ